MRIGSIFMLPGNGNGYLFGIADRITNLGNGILFRGVAHISRDFLYVWRTGSEGRHVVKRLCFFADHLVIADHHRLISEDGDEIIAIGIIDHLKKA